MRNLAQHDSSPFGGAVFLLKNAGHISENPVLALSRQIPKHLEQNFFCVSRHSG
jgi:hypothetical protein